MSPLPIALSPCPNDTFLFHAWIKGLVGLEVRPEPTYADIETLNEWAFEDRFPLTKLSFSCFKHVLKNYQLLPIGAALGIGMGPKLIAKKPFSLSELSSKQVALPGKFTTAHLLFDSLLGTCQSKVFCRYDEVLSLLANGSADCGVIIHETRFTFQKAGFIEIADLGSLWDQIHRTPLPLGGLAIRRNLSDCQKKQITQSLKDSLSYARQYPDESIDFILSLSQEKEQNIVDRHIQTYVNQETEILSEEGIFAIGALLKCPDHTKWLYQPEF